MFKIGFKNRPPPRGTRWRCSAPAEIIFLNLSEKKLFLKPKILEKKNSRHRHTIGLTDSFDSIQIKSNKTKTKLEFQTLFEKVTLEPL